MGFLPTNCRWGWDIDRERDRVGVGELEIDHDSDTWADWDEDVHGTWDTEENQEEYPEGFRWTCCDQAGDASGCTKGNHEAHPDRSKKATGDGAGSGSDNADHITIEDDSDEEE